MIRIKGMRLLAGFALGLLCSLGAVQAGQAVEGSAKADKLEACVRDTPFMRRNHFELIKHQRDVTVHQGIRKTTDSLAGCVDCHARYDQQGQPVPVTAPGEFCAGCHAYTAVTLDCFSCHSAVPSAQSAALLPAVEARMGSFDPDMIDRAHAGLDRAANAGDTAQATDN